MRKSPEQLVRIAAKALGNIVLKKSDEDDERVITKRLGQMKDILYGDSVYLAVNEEEISELVTALLAEEGGLICALVDNLDILPFECRKSVSQIFNNLLRKNKNNFADYVLRHFEIVQRIITLHENADIVLNCGSMLRECSGHELLAHRILESPQFYLFLDEYVHFPHFDASTDAFNTVREFLTLPSLVHLDRFIATQFLEAHYDVFFEKYATLLNSDNYVVRRRSLKLLGELLLDRCNFNIMIKFISSKRNLKMVMGFLRDPSPNIQFEGFHVLKVFIANPKKTKEILTILSTNRHKLISFLTNMSNKSSSNAGAGDDDSTSGSDVHFEQEREMIISTLQCLKSPEEEPRSV